MLTEPKQKIKFESKPFVKPKDIGPRGKVATVTSEPRIVEVKGFNTEKKSPKLFVDVKIGSKNFTYSPNNTSWAHLIKKLGKDEKKWLKKKFDLMLVNQVVDQKLRDVIYVKGAFQKR